MVSTEPVYSYDKVKIFSFLLKDQIVVLSAEYSANAENIIEKTLEYINTMGAKLSLYPPSNIMNEEKKEMLRNLLESEIPEEMIAEQLDLDTQTVKKLIQEMSM
jgi:DNA invertase Pin-like site-specific DNA recombinase